METGRTARGEELLVDGYNLLHAAALLRAHGAGSLQAARHALERALGRYARRTAAHVVVFYDGDGKAEAASGPRAHGGQAPLAAASGWVEVRFSRAPEDADEMLKQAIQRRHGARSVRVITSDRQIRQHARRHRVATTAAADFARELAEAPPPTAPPALPPPPELDPDLSLNPAEVDRWERLFRERPAPDPRAPEHG